MSNHTIEGRDEAIERLLSEKRDRANVNKWIPSNTDSRGNAAQKSAHTKQKFSHYTAKEPSSKTNAREHHKKGDIVGHSIKKKPCSNKRTHLMDGGSPTSVGFPGGPFQKGYVEKKPNPRMGVRPAVMPHFQF